MNYLESAKPRLPVSIIIEFGNVQNVASFDAQIDIKEDYAVETPNYPVERDFDTTISTINKQVQLNVNLFLTPYPVTWDEFFGRSIEMVKETLIRMYWMHYPVTVMTQGETYTDMAIKSLTFKRSPDTGDAYDVSAVFVHVQPTEYRIEMKSRGVVGQGGTPNPDEVGITGGELEVETAHSSKGWFNSLLESYRSRIGFAGGERE